MFGVIHLYEAAYRLREVVGVDQYLRNAVLLEKLKPPGKQGVALYGNQTFRNRVRDRPKTCSKTGGK